MLYHKMPFALSLSKGSLRKWASTSSARTVLALSLIFGPSRAHAETIAITGGKVIIGDGSAPIEGGTVVIRDGNIVAAGSGIAVPAGALQVDASGKWVTPGIFAGFSRLGLSEVDAVNGTNDKSGGKSGFSAGIDIAPWL